MMHSLFIGSSSACFERETGKPFRTEERVQVLLNGEALFDTDRNFFSLFDLQPETTYLLSVDGEELVFTTASESCCYSVLDFGAVGDGVTLNTRALQTAINFLPENGRLLVPAGTYLTGPLMMKSHMTLELEEGAVLLGTTDKNEYPVVPANAMDLDSDISQPVGIWEGNAYTMRQALICASYAKDLVICGRGTVDGNAQNGDWWHRPIPTDIARPRLFFLANCENVTVHGITGQNAASWQFHPYCSDHVSFYGITVLAPKDSPNTDGIDPEGCDYVNIIGCEISVGDDCIAIKSGKLELQKRNHRPANHHTIRNCLMQFGHGAVTLGSEIAGGAINLTVNSCEFNRTDRGLRIKTRRGRGKACVIDGVLFENIRMNGVLTPIVLNMWYNCNDPDRYSEYNTTREALPVDERTPRLGRFEFRNMVCENCEVAACYCDGLPEQPIDSVTLSDIRFHFSETAAPDYPAMMNNKKLYCRAGLYFDNVRELCVRNVSLENIEGEELMANHCGKAVRE